MKLENCTIFSIRTTLEGKVIVDMVSDNGRYFSEDGTEVISFIYGKKVQPRKIAKYLRKGLINRRIGVESKSEERKLELSKPSFQRMFHRAVISCM